VIRNIFIKRRSDRQIGASAYPLLGWSGRAPSLSASKLAGGKNSFHVVGPDERGAIVLRRKWSRGQVETWLANIPPCLIGVEACVGAHHLSRRLKMLGHDARLMPAKYVPPYSKGQKNDFRDAEAITEAVQRPTMGTSNSKCPVTGSRPIGDLGSV
jgi:transposase